ncbi:DUF2442 domain-containing protein [Rhodocyclaceae bacterium]
MYWDVIEVKATGNRILAVKFADGLAGTVRLDPSFCTGVFGPLLADALLEQATVKYGAVTWPNGLDLAPDIMYKEISQNPTRHYEVGSRQR